MSTSASVQHMQERHSIIKESPKARVSFRFPQRKWEGWEKGNHPKGPVKLGGTLLPIWRQNGNCVAMKSQQLKP